MVSKTVVPRTGGQYDLKLYVSGASQRSQRAITNLNAICDEYLKDNYVLEVIDIYRSPQKALEADVLASPTLIKAAPVPTRRMIGDLSDSQRVLMLLGVKPKG